MSDEKSLIEILRAMGPSINELSYQPKEKNMSVNLYERARTHGDFRDVASYSQSIKEILHSGKNWPSLNDSQKESLEFIAAKMARILNGNANFRDHWDDIAGYGQLGSDSLAVQPVTPPAAPQNPNIDDVITQALQQAIIVPPNENAQQ